MQKETGPLSSTTEKKVYKCHRCRDAGYILSTADDGTAFYSQCSCRETERYRQMLVSSGISGALRNLRFENYNAYDPQTKHAKAMAECYCSDFAKIENSRHNSICFLGQVGAGKTHLSAAILNVLFDSNIGVLYMPYRSAIMELKQNVMDERAYSSLMEKYKQARVLLIDDFAKGTCTPSDVNHMFDIINDRYLNNRPLIISSQLDIAGILDFDEAAGSRILHMCQGRIAMFSGKERNYRLRI